MSKRDYYEILGVAKTASDGEMKVAFRKLAMTYHPDKNPGNKDAEIKFKEINEAYQCLSDGQKRAAYDRFGHDAFTQGGGQGGPGFGNEFGDFMSDIFDNFFGDGRGGQQQARGRGGAPGRERGADLRFSLEISLEEAFTGKAETIKIPTSITCETCAGSGAKPGSKPRTCQTCAGYGRVRAAQGFFAIERTCPNCHGRGEIVDDPCTACAGAG
ncbi:MAG: molecular chaperone DnaJ, partial [Methylobacterium sp.]